MRDPVNPAILALEFLMQLVKFQRIETICDAGIGFRV